MVIYAMVGLASGSHVCLTGQAAHNRDQIFKTLEQFISTDIVDENIARFIISPWFLCSYSSAEHRHTFKIAANKFLTNYVNSFIDKKLKNAINKNSSRKITKKKLNIVVINEVYRSGHAMYRCYHDTISNLKEAVNLICFTRKSDIDDVAEKDFSKVVYIDELGKPNKIIASILKHSPDAIIFPSLGMSEWTTQIATQRIASKQILLPGHPASSFLDTIDYLIPLGIEPAIDELQQFCSEKVVCVDGKNSVIGGFEPHKLLPKTPPTNQIHDGIVRIAINGVIQKITPELIDVCNKLTKLSTKALKFIIFMPTKNELTRESAHNIILRLLPNAECIGYQEYPQYLQTMANCDFCLPTFPFGGANSNVDTIFLNVPKIILKGQNDLASYTDETVWQIFFEKIEELYANDIDELIEIAMKLINDLDFKKAMIEKLKKFDVSKVMYSEEERLIGSKKTSGFIQELVRA